MIRVIRCFSLSYMFTEWTKKNVKSIKYALKHYYILLSNISTVNLQSVLIFGRHYTAPFFGICHRSNRTLTIKDRHAVLET